MTEKDVTPPPADAGLGSKSGDHIDGDICIDLVAGLVPPPDLERIVRHVGACRPCEAMLIAAGGDWETIRSRPAPETWRISVSGVRNGKPGVVAGRLRILRLAVPLSLAAALLFLVLVRRPPVPATGLTYWIPATSEILELRSAHSSEADSLFWVGLKAYKEQDVPNATTLLMEAKAAGGMEDLRLLHLASLLVNSGRGSEALEIFATLDIESLPQPWRDEASWMEYLALVMLRRTEQADERLAELEKKPGRIGDLARERRSR